MDISTYPQGKKTSWQCMIYMPAGDVKLTQNLNVPVLLNQLLVQPGAQDEATVVSEAKATTNSDPNEILMVYDFLSMICDMIS